MSKWLAIVGMGEDGYAGLSARARLKLDEAEEIVGSSRLLAFLPDLKGRRHEWPQPFAAVVDRIKPLRGKKTVVLATGDPMNYGVARKLMEFVPFDEMEIVPSLSALSLAAARMGWSLADCDTLSLHGRDIANLEPFVQPGARLMVLTANASTITQVARRLVARRFDKSIITVLENLGGTRESVSSFVADAPSRQDFSDLNTLAVQCVASPDAHVYARIAGLPDDAFLHDGQLTKREVRAATLAALAPAPDQLLWDVGAGCGSVAIEWMRSTRGCEAIAFEPNAARREMMAKNADRLGTPRLKIVAGRAPDNLAGQPAPDAAFIGGGIGEKAVFESVWNSLKPGGRFVANVVTLEGEVRLIALQAAHGGELVRMDVSHLTRIGPYRALEPRMAVLQWRAMKPW
jgi:precorrin-6Y C5,15-methyltransferase (decarboxylating)